MTLRRKRLGVRIGILTVIALGVLLLLGMPGYGSFESHHSSGPDSGADTGPSAENSILAIEGANKNLAELSVQNLSPGELGSRIYTSLGYIMLELKNIKSASDSERVLLDLQKTLEHLSVLLDKTQNKDMIISRLGDITNMARGLVINIQDNTKNAALSSGFLEAFKPVLQKIDGQGLPGITLKNRILDFATEAANKVSEVKSETKYLIVAGGKGTVTYDPDMVASKVTFAKEYFNQITGAMDKALGTDPARNVEMTVTLRTDRPDNITSLKSSMDQRVIEAIRSAGVPKLGIRLGEASVRVGSDILKPGESSLLFSAEFSSVPTWGFPAQTRPLVKGFIADVSLGTESGAKAFSGNPAQLSLNLSALDLSAVPAKDLRNFGIYVLDESSGVWTPVGGNFDTVTKVIRANRGHLSKYTVLITDKGFSDVQNSWAKDDINELLGKGVVSDGAAFAPKDLLTREEFARWIAKAYGLEGEGAVLPFTDISKNHPYYKELAGAYSQGLIKGKSDQIFDPKGKVTRQEMATLISNALSKYNKTATDAALIGNLVKYPDNGNIAAWSKNSVAMVNELGIMQGDSKGFRPGDYITKEEAAKVLKRIYN